MKHKVLFISYYFPPAGGGSIVRAHAFARHLPDQNILPYVLTVSEEYYPSFAIDTTLLDDLDCSRVKIVRTDSLEPKGSVFDNLQANIYGVNNSAGYFQKYIKPALRWLFHLFMIPDEHILWIPSAIREGAHLIRQQKIDAIFVTTPPHSCGMIGAYLSRRCHIPLILDVRDDWIGNPLFDNGAWHKKFLSKKIERWIIRTARRIIAVTPESVGLYHQKYPDQQKNKFLLIPNGFDIRDLPENPDEPIASDRQPLRLTYIGGLPTKRSPIPLLHALRDLANELPVAELFQFDFYGNAKQEFIQATSELKLDNIVRFHNFVSRKESLQQLARSDAALLIIPEEEGSQTAIPGKIYEYLGARKFVIGLCPLHSAAARLIREMNLGIIAPPNDVEGIKNALRDTLSKFDGGTLAVNIPAEEMLLFERSAQTQLLAEAIRYSINSN